MVAMPLDSALATAQLDQSVVVSLQIGLSVLATDKWLFEAAMARTNLTAAFAGPETIDIR
jgi:hypothetical protein